MNPSKNNLGLELKLDLKLNLELERNLELKLVFSKNGFEVWTFRNK